MLLPIPEILTSEQVAHARQVLDQADWIDGRATAGHQAVRVKDNMQLPEDHPAARELGEMVVGACSRNAMFVSAALPLRVFPPLFNRYRGGQSFGTHVDTAIRQITGTPHRIRTDLSATLFLADPSEYDGGELVVEDNYGVHNVKLPAGHMILYPATSLHRVGPALPWRPAGFFLLDPKHGARRRAAHNTIRSRHGDPENSRGPTGASIRGATHWRLSQPAAAVGGPLVPNDSTPRYRLLLQSNLCSKD